MLKGISIENTMRIQYFRISSGRRTHVNVNTDILPIILAEHNTKLPMPLERCNLDRKYFTKTIWMLKSPTCYPGTPPVPPPLLGDRACGHPRRLPAPGRSVRCPPQWCQVLHQVTIMEMSQLKLQLSIRWWQKCRVTRNSLHARLDQQLQLECGRKKLSHNLFLKPCKGRRVKLL